MKIIDVEGIGPKYAETLNGHSITSTDDLLAATATKASRAKLAEASGISEKLLLEWANHVDLMRIDGVGSEYSDLLEAAGVDSCTELATRVPANLAAKLQEVNDNKALVRSVPSEKVVAGWIEQAKTLPKIVTH
jgi:predicted flap endonuclease-1-like 5' DNA nuclease